MPSDRPAQRFQDILDNIGRIESHTAGMDAVAFVADTKTLDAVERCLGRISEAAVKLGSRVEELAPDLPWRAIRSFGNVLRHEYDVIDPWRLWEIVTTDLPALKTAVRAAVDQSDDGKRP